MSAYSFKKQFVDPIRANTKLQTIRAPRLGRGRHARVGEEMQLYYGMRTKQCRLIAVGVCRSVETVQLDFDVGSVRIEDGAAVYFLSSPEDRERFAQNDGFADWDQMRRFWRLEHQAAEFDGVLLKWRLLRVAP